MSILTVEGLDLHYGGVHALRGVSLHVEAGEVVALLGNNGAGKTSTLSAISGLERPTAGTITFEGDDITRAKPWDLVKRGIIHVPEGRHIFSTMTVTENLQLGGYTSTDTAGIKARIDHVFDLFPVLAQRRGQEGGTLSGGEQQMLAIGRALVAQPKLMLLDEPSMGLAPLIVKRIMEIIATINADGVTCVLVEQNARAALRISSRGYVIENGEITLEGSRDELISDPRIVEAYLGVRKNQNPDAEGST